MLTTKYKSNSPTLKPTLGITQLITDREGEFCTLRFSKFTLYQKQNDTCWPSGSGGGGGRWDYRVTAMFTTLP